MATDPDPRRWVWDLYLPTGPPLRRGVCFLPAEGFGWYMGVRDPVGGPGPRLFWLGAPLSGTRGDTGPVPEREAGPGPLVR